MSKKSFNVGIMIGALLGGLVAYFFSPRSGKENRKMAKKAYKDFMKSVDEKGLDETVKEVFGTASQEGGKLFQKVKKELDSKLNEAYKTFQDLDYEQYQEIVTDTLKEVEKEASATKERLSQLKEYLLAQWNKLKEE